MLAKKTNGSLWTWGYNAYGQLGINDTVNRSSPVQIGALTTWTKFSPGAYHSAGITSDGKLWTWGYNAYGQLGHGGTTNRSSPTQVGALTTWSDVFCGPFHTFATKTDGTLWAWGRNNYVGENDQVYFIVGGLIKLTVLYKMNVKIYLGIKYLLQIGLLQHM